MDNTSTAIPTEQVPQYSTVQVNPVPVYPVYQTMPAAQLPAEQLPAAQVEKTPITSTAASVVKSITESNIASAGVLGFIVVSTGTMGANLNKMTKGDMNLTQAAGDSLAKGAIGGTAAACATAASSSLTSGGVAGLAITLAAATGVSYLINRVIS